MLEYDDDPEKPIMREIVGPFHKPLRIISDNGVHIVRLAAGERKFVHPDLFRPAISAGCGVPDGIPGQEISEDKTIERLEEAMRVLLASGNKDHFTVNGDPRFASLKMHVANFTKEQQMIAWEHVSRPEQAEGGEESYDTSVSDSKEEEDN